MSYENEESQQTPFDALNAVHETADVVRAAADAGEVQDSLDEADEASDELKNVKELVEVVNANEAWSQPALAFLQNHLDSISRRLDIRSIRTGVSLESREEIGNIKVSLEDINQIIAAVDNSSAELQERSVAALVDLINSLGEAIPKLELRLDQLCQRAESMVDPDSTGTVSLGYGDTLNRLVVNNEVPESLPNFINEYTSYGNVLLGRYSEVAFQSVMRTSLFEGGFDQSSYQGFWDCLGEKLKQIEDPRKELTEAQMLMTLPGAGPLFGGPGEQVDDVLATRERMRRFVTAFRPVSLSDFSVAVQTDADADQSDKTAPALKPSEIRDAVKYFCTLLSQVDLPAVSQACKAAWIDAGRTIRQVKDALQNADETLLRALDEDDSLLPAYLETLFTLSAWPILNYLTNLTLFGNAFVDYANRSLDPGNVIEAPAADEIPQESTAADTTAEVADAEAPDNTVNVQIDGQADDPAADLEAGAKPTEPAEVPDTGETPADPQDATGEGGLAIVTNVEETTAEAGEAAEAAADETSVDVSADAEDVPDETAIDVAAAEETGAEEETSDESENNDDEQETVTA